MKAVDVFHWYWLTKTLDFQGGRRVRLALQENGNAPGFGCRGEFLIFDRLFRNMMGLGNSPFGEAIFIVVFDRLPHKVLETLCGKRQLFRSLRVKGLQRKVRLDWRSLFLEEGDRAGAAIAARRFRR